eukprot:TRINITY_DN27360_c0_g3_i1.p1 TRINITY_DN27360_c0_g3~~TRINITY_DN27360_c0_g3_i1.p1  ORF type:complete len:992 (+),score=181.06 TRINITY_DN27360_c0_g3_i1:314-3289(+)
MPPSLKSNCEGFQAARRRSSGKLERPQPRGKVRGDEDDCTNSAGGCGGGGGTGGGRVGRDGVSGHAVSSPTGADGGSHGTVAAWMTPPSKPSTASGRRRPHHSLQNGLGIEETTGESGKGCSRSKSPNARETPEKRCMRSGRFLAEEIMCFKKLPTPSSGTNEMKLKAALEAGWDKPVGNLRRVCSDGGSRPGTSHSLAIAKNDAEHRKVYLDENSLDSNGHLTMCASSPELLSPAGKAAGRPASSSTVTANDTLAALEDMTATVLEQIFPKLPKASKEQRGQSPSRSPERESTLLLGAAGVRSLRKSSGDGFNFGPADEESSSLLKPRRLKSIWLSPATKQDTHSKSESRQLMISAELSQNVGGSSVDNIAAGSTSPTHQKRTGQQRVLNFRQRLLDKFQTVKGAFEVFATESETGLKRELTKKQFSRFLMNHFPTMSKEDHVAIFDFLDADKNGHISLEEFHAAIEAAAPVRSLEDLRRRWIALGFNAMRHGIQAMCSSGLDGSKRLSYQEFAAALSRAGVEDEEEHDSLFKAVLDPYDTRGTVSLDQLSGAIAAVSPALLLEEIRERLVRKHGDLREAYAAMDALNGESRHLPMNMFFHYASENFKLTGPDIRKAFNLIDIDKNSHVSRAEFISALRLSEPSLTLEGVRRKVRQRFHSITDAFANRGRVKTDNLFDELRSSIVKAEDGETTDRLKDCTDFVTILKAVQLTEEDTQCLFELVDIDGDGKVTDQEFERGIKLFAPACALEDLRLHCLRYHRSIPDTFKAISQERREAVLDTKSLEQLLRDVAVPVDTVCVAEMVGLLETTANGGVTVGQLIAALLASAPGAQVPLSSDQLYTKARQNIRWQMAPFRRSATDLRVDLRAFGRECMQDDVADEESASGQKRSQDNLAAMVSMISAMPDEKRRREIIQHGATMHSFKRVSRWLARVDEPVMERVHGYYVSAGSRLAHDVPLVAVTHSRSKHFLSCNKHRVLLGSDERVQSTPL